MATLDSPVAQLVFTLDNRYVEGADMQEAVLALLAKDPSYGYELRNRLRTALGHLGDDMNAGQIYVTLTRLEKAGLVTWERESGSSEHPDRKVYTLTADGHRRVAEWLADLTWPKPAPTEFFLKLVAAAATDSTDPLALIDSQRRELLRRLRDAQRAAMDEASGSKAALLLDGVAIRLQADLAWLDSCERHWKPTKESS